MFPVLSDLVKARQLLGSGLIPKVAGDFKAASDAVKAALLPIQILSDDVDSLAAQINGLFGVTTTMAAAPTSFLEDHRRERLIAKVKSAAEKEYRTNGLKNCDLSGMTPRLGIESNPTWSLDDATWGIAEAHGAENLILEHLNAVPGFTEAMSPIQAIGDGTLWQRIVQAFQNLWKWVADHEDQILAAAKILLTLLMFLGIL